MIGPKLRAGLRAYEHMDLVRRAGLRPPFADEILMAQGYPPKVADSIIRRLGRRGWIESGVTERSGWLTAEGRGALATIREEVPA